MVAILACRVHHGQRPLCQGGSRQVQSGKEPVRGAKLAEQTHSAIQQRPVSIRAPFSASAAALPFLSPAPSSLPGPSCAAH